MLVKFHSVPLTIAVLVVILALGGVINRIRRSSGNEASLDEAARIARQRSSLPEAEESLRKLGERREAETKILAGPRYDSFADDGHVNEELLRLAGIDLERRDEVEAILRDNWGKLSKELQDRSSYLSAKSDAAAGIEVFLIKGSEESARAAVDAFETDLRNAFGKGAARVLVPYFTRVDYFGGFGKNDLEIQSSLHQNARGNQTIKIVKIKAVDPVSGKVLMDQTLRSKDVYRLYYGSLLANEILSEDWDCIER